MAWDSGTITSAAPTDALSTKLKAMVGGAGVANWSFVENVPAGTGVGQSGAAAYSVDVFKCATAGTNGHGFDDDYFVGFCIPTSDGAVASNFLVAEDYLDIAGNPADADRGKFKRPCQAGATVLNSVPTGTGFWITDAYGTANSYSIASIRASTPTLSTTGFTYYIKMTNRMLIVSANSTALWGAAIMDSLTSVSDLMPLVAFSSAGSGGFSRLPSVVTGAITNMWGFNTYSWNTPIAVTRGGSNATNTNDIWQGNKVHVSRLLALSRATQAAGFQVGAVRGLFPADILAFQQGGSVANGDTMTIDGNTWVVIGSVLSFTGSSMQYIVRGN